MSRSHRGDTFASITWMQRCRCTIPERNDMHWSSSKANIGSRYRRSISSAKACADLSEGHRKLSPPSKHQYSTTSRFEGKVTQSKGFFAFRLKHGRRLGLMEDLPQ